MYICVYVCHVLHCFSVCLYACIFVCVCMSVRLNFYMSVCMHFLLMYVCLYVWVCVCVFFEQWFFANHEFTWGPSGLSEAFPAFLLISVGYCSMFWVGLGSAFYRTDGSQTTKIKLCNVLIVSTVAFSWQNCEWVNGSLLLMVVSCYRWGNRCHSRANACGQTRLQRRIAFIV